MRYIAGIVVCIALAGCATAPQATDEALSPAHAYYAAERTYQSVLEAAIDYKDGCISRPLPLQTECRKVVDVLRRVNREALDIGQIAEMAINEDDDDLLAEATDQLEDLRDELRQQVLDQMAAEAASNAAKE